MMILIVPSVILLIGLVDDLKSRKIHNKLVLACLVFAIISRATLHYPDFSILLIGLYASLLAILLNLPLVLAKIIGAGDMKLMVAFGMASNMNAVFQVTLISIVWGALLGVLRAILSGEGKKLFAGTFSVLLGNKLTTEQTHKIPYSVALFFGWLTYLALNRWQL